MRRFRRLHRDEDGFGLVEAMVALGLMLTSTLIMAYTASASFGPTAVARQRQAATGLADEAIEQVRALPFDTLKKGLDNTDLAGGGDPNIQANCPTVGEYCYLGEPVPHGTNANVVPLVPHRRTITVRTTPYTVGTYVTYYQGNATTNTFRITSLVTWAQAETHRTLTVQIQTIVNSPSGCLSTATHPFSAPCQPYLYGTATLDAGSVSIAGTMQSVALDHATVWITGASSSASIEQVSSVLGFVRSAGVDLQLTAAALQLVGKTTTSSGSDNDPSQPSNDYQQVSAPNELSGVLSATGGGDGIALTSSGGDAGTTTSTTSASFPTPSHACANPSGINQTDLLPCGNSNIMEGGAQSPNATAVLTLNGTSANLGTATVVSVAPAPSAGVTYVNRDVVSGDGLITSQVSRSLGTVQLAGLPSNVVAPANWGGYLVRLTNFTDSVQAQAGAGTAAPTVAAAGTISYWNGNGYSSMTIAPGVAASIPVAAVHLSYQPSPPSGPFVTVDIVATLSTGGTSTTDPAACGGNCTRAEASARSSSPIVGDLTYAVSYSGAAVCDLTFGVDLGAITAKANYTAAPGG